MNKLALGITLIAAALCGCSPMPPMPPMDAEVEHTASGEVLSTRADVPVDSCHRALGRWQRDEQFVPKDDAPWPS